MHFFKVQENTKIEIINSTCYYLILMKPFSISLTIYPLNSGTIALSFCIVSITLITIRRYGPYGIWTQNTFCWNRSLLQHACKLYLQWKMRKFFVEGTMYLLFSYNRLFPNKIHTPYTDLNLQLYQYMNIHLQQYIAHITQKPKFCLEWAMK